MKKQAEISFSSTSAELNVFHALMNHVRQEKTQVLALINQAERSNKFVDRLKKRFV